MSDSPPTPPRACWTPARQRIFLHALLDTGSVTRAATAAGMSRSSAQRLRARLAGSAFDRAWDRVLALHRQSMADPLSPHPGAAPSTATRPAAASPEPPRGVDAAIAARG